ncbi:MAG: CotH kinase family protein, partial [Planctomycetota bacterium]|nr:CotH kinase family protein [Planctomycetota bacterium]
MRRHGLRGPALLAPGAVTLALLLATGAHAQGPLLTEFQASNANTLLDTDGDSSDWIEVHNPSATSLDLSDWYLSDDAGDLTRWQIPSTTLLPAGAYLIVFASGKDRVVPGAEYHTNFKLKSEGEFLALIRPDGNTVEQAFAPSFPQQYADVSYGLSFDPGPTSNETYFTAPTPGSANGPGGPIMINPGFTPTDPGPGEDVRVWVSVPSDLGGGAVTLTWRLDFNGESFLPLLDDGQGADLAAGDGIYSASVPGQTFVPGQMVRWRMEAIEGSTLRSASLPPFVDPTGSAKYFGTAVRDDAVSTALPRWQYWLEVPGKGETRAGTRASVYYNGEFYDNVFVRIRGGSSAWYPKKSYKFDFNKDQRLLFPSGLRHDEANINTTWADKAFVRQTLSYELYTLAGCVSPGSYPVRLEQNGAFRSVAIFVEEPGEEPFLEEHGLDPEGALYKMYNVLNSWKGGVEKKTRLQEGHKDLKQLVQGLSQTSAQELEKLLFDAIDLDQCFNYLAVTSLIHDNDHIAKNYYLYRDSDGDKEW